MRIYVLFRLDWWQVSDDFSVNENISQFDIKTLIKDCFGLVILRSSKFLKPFLNMISERLFIMTVQYFGIPHTWICVSRCLLSCRRPIREQLAHEEGISPIILRVNKVHCPITSQHLTSVKLWGIFIHKFIGGLGPGWVDYDATSSHCLWNYRFYYGLKLAK